MAQHSPVVPLSSIQPSRPDKLDLLPTCVFSDPEDLVVSTASDAAFAAGDTGSVTSDQSSGVDPPRRGNRIRIRRTKSIGPPSPQKMRASESMPKVRYWSHSSQ